MCSKFIFPKGTFVLTVCLGITTNLFGQNLVVNSDFRQADNVNCTTVGFTSEMKLDCVPPSNGHNYFYITNTGAGWNGQYWAGVKDHTPGDTTNFLMGDGGSQATVVWKQSIKVGAGKKYSFSAWFINANVNGIYTGNTSKFEVWVKGKQSEKILETGLLGKTTPWTEYSGTYTADFTETVELSILNLETVQGGNDFAIDDIVFVSDDPDTCRMSSFKSLSLCLNDSLQLIAGEGQNYSWQPNNFITTPTSQNPFVFPNSGVTYVVNYLGMDSCLHTDSFEIQVQMLPKVELPVSQRSICIEDSGSVQINWSLSNYKQIEWTPSKGVSDIHIPNPQFNPIQNTMYVVIVEDSNGCEASDSFELRRINCNCQLNIPNAFSPNVDDLNDQFKPLFHDCNLVLEELRIYNRWGEMLFKSDLIDAFWDGTYKGKNAPNGVYFWILSYKHDLNGRIISDVKSGTLNLLR